MFVFPGNVRRSQAQRRRQHLDTSGRVFHGMVFLVFLGSSIPPCVPRHGVPRVPWVLELFLLNYSLVPAVAVLTVVPACTHVSVLARLPPLTSVTVRVAK